MEYKYKDISSGFRPHPKTGDLSTVSDANSVNQSLRNLIYTNFYEVPFSPKIGSNIQARLFDLMTPMTGDIIKNDIKDVIENYESRVEILNITVVADEVKNGVNVTIRYQLRTTTNEVVLNYFLSRII